MEGNQSAVQELLNHILRLLQESPDSQSSLDMYWITSRISASGYRAYLVFDIFNIHVNI